MSGTWCPVWKGYPKGPWVLVNTLTQATYSKPGAKHFWHGDYAAAVKLADRLNA